MSTTVMRSVLSQSPPNGSITLVMLSTVGSPLARAKAPAQGDMLFMMLQR